MSVPINLIAVQNELGESPLWHPKEQLLYWVDICAHPAIYSYNPASQELRSTPLSVTLTALGWRESGGFIAATRSGFATWRPRTGLILRGNPEADHLNARLNDGAVDPQGRFWAGSMQVGAQSSSLYRYNTNHTWDQADSGFIVSNGITWSPDQKTMYVTDSFQHVIYAYNYEASTGSIANRHVWVDTSAEPGVPDGLTVDNLGGIWSVFCRGWKIIRYQPSGEKDFEITIPVECPTSLAFGGAALDTLFITSSSGLVKPENRPAQPWAGNLFILQTGFTGLPEPGFRG